MVETNVKITVVHELAVKGKLTLEEIDAKVRKLLLDGTSDARFWELGKDFCYEDSYPAQIVITTSFNI